MQNRARLCIGAAILVGILGLVLAPDAFVPSSSGNQSFAFFKANVAPILAKSCSSRDEMGANVCHGRSVDKFAQIDANSLGYKSSILPHLLPRVLGGSCASGCHGEKSGAVRYSFPLSSRRRLETDRQLTLAFEKSRELARFDGAARFSKFLRMPLGAQAGGFGLNHAGGELYENATDPEFRQLAEWVAIENRETRHEQARASEAETAFKKRVLPVFARNTCMAPACHIFNHSSFILDPGLPAEDLTAPLEDRFSPEQLSFNRLTSKGLIQSLVQLGGDVTQSRLLKKCVPLDAGGILHRGGNDQFFSGPADPDFQAVKDWLLLEQKELLARVKIAGKPVRANEVGKVRGLVFVRTPTGNHRRYLDVGKYLPGGDLFLLKVKEGETPETARGPALNLTGRFHPGKDADVRSPCVRYDGRAVLFSMRVGEQDNLNLYEISLDEGQGYVEGSLRRLTFPPARVNGLPVHCTNPIYVPDPTDSEAATGGLNLERADVAFVSNLAGAVVQSVERGVVGEADGGDLNTIEDLDRPEPDGTFVGKRIYVVDGPNAGTWRRIVAFKNRLFTAEKRSFLTVSPPFAAPADSSMIYVIEKEPAEQPGFLPCYSVYGMKYAPFARGQTDERLDRQTYDGTLTRLTFNHGQDLDLSVRSTGEVFYASQRSACDKYGRPIFNVASCRRHLDTRFSFPTHHGNRSQVLIYAYNHELPSGIDIHVGLHPDSLWGGGNLIVSDHQFGPDLEARNPNDYTTGVFDEAGVPRSLQPDISNTRFAPQGQGPAHPRFVFKTHPLHPVTGAEAVSWNGYSPGGVYRDCVPFSDGRILVSHSVAPIDNRSPAARPDFDLYALTGDPGFQPPAGKGFAGIRKVRLNGASTVGMSEVEAYPVSIRLKEKVNAGNRPRTEHLIRYPGTAVDHRPAKYLERNYWLIDAIMRDPTPVGKHAAYAQDPVTGKATTPLEQVKFVRMVEVVPVSPDLARPLDRTKIRNGDPESTLVSNGIHAIKRMVVEAPVHEDGSVQCMVPSGTPLLIQSLNGDRMALRQEARTYFFAPNEPFSISPAPSEKFQTCAVCMGSASGRAKDVFGPTNLFLGQGLVKAIALAEQTSTRTSPGLKAKDRLTIDFVRDIQPLLDRHCTACHQGKTPAAGLSLTGEKTEYYTSSYEGLMALEEPQSGWYGKKKYVDERDGLAVRSYLAAKLHGKQLLASKPLTGDTPHPSPQLFESSHLAPAPLSDAERLLLVRWMDFGATFRGEP